MPNSRNNKFKLGLANAREAELVAGLEQALMCIKRVYQAGYDSLLDANVRVDPPLTMFQNDPTVRDIQALIAKHK